MATYPKTPSLNRRFVSLYMSDLGTAGGTAGSVFFTPGYRGRIIKVSTVAYAATATANTVLTTSIGTTAVTGGVVTVTFSGSAAGDIATASPSAARSFGPTDYIKVVSDGGTSSVSPAVITMELEAT